MKKPDPDQGIVRVLFILVFLGLAALLLNAAGKGEKLTLAASNLLLVAAALGHAWHLLGWQRATLFFGLAFTLAWAAETLSLATGLATPYHYTAALGPLLGKVPVVVPLGWSAMIYNSHIIANLMTDGTPTARRRGGLWTLGLALLTALVMTAWDLTLDPYMVLKEKAWIWDQGGIYFGIPAANFVSWVETVLIIDLSIRLSSQGLPLPDRSRAGRWFAALPVFGYALIGLPDVFIGVPEATRVLSPFAMGIPILAALGRLAKREERPA
jgi:putative membrane protein